MIKRIFLALLICSPVMASSQVFLGIQIDQRSNFVYTEDKSFRVVGSAIIQPISVTLQIPWKPKWSGIFEIGHDVVSFYTESYLLKYKGELHKLSQNSDLKYVRGSLGLRFRPTNQKWFVSFGLCPSVLYGVRSNVRGSLVDDSEQEFKLTESRDDYPNLKAGAFLDFGFNHDLGTHWDICLSARMDYSFVPIQPNFIPPRRVYTYGASVNLGLRYLLKK